MRRSTSEELYRRADLAFLESIATTVKACVARAPLATDEQRQTLLEDVVFAVAAHLSGSSHGGRVDGKEVYPQITYSIGEDGAGENLVGTSAMHEQVPVVTRRLAF